MSDLIGSIAKYRHYRTLISDLMLMRASKLFDKHYYITYHPSLPRYRFILFLHYLILGGQNEVDPSQTFDSDWYLERYPDALDSGMNPLIHYLKFGRKENRDTYSPIGGKYIEFIGIPGSGKTRLYKEVNLFLELKLGYIPGSKFLGNHMLNDIRMRSQSKDAYDCFCNFITEHREFFNSVLLADDLYIHPNLPDDYTKISSLNYFFTLCAFYQAIKQDKTKPWCMFDDGFYHQLARFVFDESGEIRGELSERILETIPKVDLLILMNTDVGLCIKRLKERTQGIPPRYRKLPGEELLSRLSVSHTQMKAFTDYARNLSTSVVVVDAGMPLEEGLSQVISKLSQFD